MEDWCASFLTCLNSTELKTRCLRHFYFYEIYFYTRLLLRRPRQQPFTFEIGSSLSATRIQVNYCLYRDRHYRLIVNIIHCDSAGTYNGSGTYLIFCYDFLIKNSCCSVLLGVVGPSSSSETQGQSVGSEKAGRKFASTGKRAPGYPLSPNYFQKFKRMPAPDWAQKMLCIIVPNRRTVSPEFFS